MLIKNNVIAPVFAALLIALPISFAFADENDLSAEEKAAIEIEQAILAEERADLFSALKNAPDKKVARAAVSAIWDMWQTAPDEKAQKLLDQARQRMRVYDFAGAIEYLDDLVAYAPDYAEGWNTRATTLFLQEKLDLSLVDVEKTLALEPDHFGALAGKGVILMRQGRIELSQKALKRAVAINPYLSERSLIIKEPKE